MHEVFVVHYPTTGSARYLPSRQALAEAYTGRRLIAGQYRTDCTDISVLTPSHCDARHDERPDVLGLVQQVDQDRRAAGLQFGDADDRREMRRMLIAALGRLLD